MFYNTIIKTFVYDKELNCVIWQKSLYSLIFIFCMKRTFFLMLYYGFAFYLPNSYLPCLGKFFNAVRILLCKRIFKKCGMVSTINRGVYFGDGRDVEIGDYSGLGLNNHIPNNIKIGKYVMMGPDVYIVGNGENHCYNRIDIPMCDQGKQIVNSTIIEDDCWIGARVIMTSGRHVSKGSIVAAGTVLTKDFDAFSIVGGNPAQLIKKRK